MICTCPSCGFEQNDESNMVCICGFRYVPEIIYQDTMGNNSAIPQEDEIEDQVTKNNLAAIKVGYIFFAVVIVFLTIVAPSLRLFMSYVIPTAIIGYYIYKYKPQKTKLSHEQAINDNPMDISTIVAADPKFYGNITKVELGILATFTIIIPVIISYFISRDIERFLSTTFVFGFGGSMLAVLTIIVKRSLARSLL